MVGSFKGEVYVLSSYQFYVVWMIIMITFNTKKFKHITFLISHKFKHAKYVIQTSDVENFIKILLYRIL